MICGERRCVARRRFENHHPQRLKPRPFKAKSRWPLRISRKKQVLRFAQDDKFVKGRGLHIESDGEVLPDALVAESAVVWAEAGWELIELSVHPEQPRAVTARITNCSISRDFAFAVEIDPW